MSNDKKRKKNLKMILKITELKSGKSLKLVNRVMRMGQPYKR
jgi:hypothetical protein